MKGTVVGLFFTLMCFLPKLTHSADPEKPSVSRYTRPAGDKFVLESEITTSSKGPESTYTSLTDRGNEKMTLTLRYRDKKLTSAEAIQSTKEKSSTVQMTTNGTTAEIRRGEKVETIKDIPEPIVTTAPDWSDIFLLVQRYDAKKGGKQDFVGLWIHPVKETLKLSFSIEHQGTTSITVKERKIALDQYRITLRSGAYLVWADESRTVYKLISANGKGPVFLEGFEDATKDLLPAIK
jgi:hypothetical protein